MNVLELLSAPVIRHYRNGDRIPVELRAGFDQLGRLDGDWVWLVERDGAIAGVLVAAPCHGLAMIYRVALVPGTPFVCLWALLHRFLRDIHERGYIGYMTFLDPNVDAQAKLKRIIEQAGGRAIGGSHTVMAAPLGGARA